MAHPSTTWFDSMKEGALAGVAAAHRGLRTAAVRAAAVLALVLATVAVAQPATANAAGAFTQVDGFSFGVMSDPHFFPAEYQGTRAEDYQNQISGDLRLMGENEALTTAAVDQMIEKGNLPKVLLVTGDLSSEGEQASHEGFAEQMARLQEEGVAVLVIPGNHDLYNSSAMTFQNDTQVRDNGTGDLYTTEAEFRSIYARMGYDEEATIQASNGTIESIDYYAEELGEDGIADIQGGLSYVAKTDSGVAFLMIDTEVYTTDFNGNTVAAGSGGGMMSDALRAWVKSEAAELTAEGYTIIAGVHHPVLDHQTTAETEFITDRIDIQSGENGTAKDNSNIIATELADAGIHYVFSGHMHENDVASYTTASGNVIYDMETGGLCAYPSPYRYATLVATTDGELSLRLKSMSVDEAPMNQRLDAPNGSLTDTDDVDVQEYERDAMYGDKDAETGESFITRLVMRYAARYLDQLTDIPGALQNIAGIDLYDLLLNDLLPSLLGNGTSIDLGGSIGEIEITYTVDADDAYTDGSGVHLNPTSGAAGLLGSYTVRNTDIRTEVQSVIDQIEANYIANGRLEQEISDLLENVGDVNLLNPDNPDDATGVCYTLRELLQDMFQRHNSGEDDAAMPQEMQQALNNLAGSSILQNKVEQVLSDVLFPLIDEVLGNTYINLDTLFGRNVLWSTAIEAVIGESNPSIATVLDKFGLDLTGEGGVLQGLIDQYLTSSVYTQIGGLVDAMVSGFAEDADGLDDVVDGEEVVLAASMDPEPHPTIENGALPDQVSMSLDADGGAYSRNFSWYTSTAVQGSDVQVISAEGIADGDTAAEAMDAGDGVTEETASNVEVANKAKVTLNLILITNYEIVQENHHTATAVVPAGDFYYRVGDAQQGFWTDPVLVDGDAEDPAAGYTAIVVADSQGASEADYSDYEEVLAEAESSTTDEAFALHLGDMVDDGSNENYWSWLLNTDASMALATMPVAGNHEARQDDEALANAVAAHYNVDIPEQDTSTGIYYSFVYGDVTYIVLNTNDGDAAVGDVQKQWAAGVAENAQTTWTILVTHKASYSKGSHQNDSDVLALRSWLNSFCTQHDIDLVLSGHDHTYMRTPSLTNGAEASVTTQTVTDSAGNSYEAQVNPSGTTFVIPSTSGTKYYDIVDNDLPTAFSWQGYQPVWSTLEVDGDTLFWRSYAYDAETDASTCIDSFAITKDDNLTPAEEVMQMIDALPDPNAGSEAILAAKADVEAARAAYEELEDADKEQVSNLSKLEQLEQLIEVYEDIAGKDTVDLSTGIYYDGQNDDEGQRRAAFKDAIANPNVGTIILPGDYSTAIGEYRGNTLNNQYYTVDHNVVIKAAEGSQGYADLRRCGFIVTDGATLVLEDVRLQAWQKKPFIGNTTPMNMIRVENGTLVANGNTSVLVNRDDGSTSGFNDESWRGHAIIVGNPDSGSATGERAVYLNLSDSGTISGLRDSVVQHAESSSASDHVCINGGTYNTIYAGNSSVNLSCGLEINGGTFTKVTSNGDLTVTGGTFNGGSVDYPIYMGGSANLYVENATSFTAGTSGRVFSAAGELHISDAALGKLGEGLGLDIAAGDATASGWPLTATATGLGNTDGGTIYAIGQQITTMPGMAANTQGALETTVDGSTLSAVADLAPDQTAYAYARYHVASGSALMGYIDGNTENVYAYSGYTVLSNPNATVSLTADPGNIVAWSDEAAPTVQLTADIEPNDATRFVTWESSDADIATVDENGKVTFEAAGQVTITATHVTTGAKATITLTALEVSMTGSDTYGPSVEEGLRYGLELTAGDLTVSTLPEGYTVQWALSEGAAATVMPGANPLTATLVRSNNEASSVTLTATLMKDGASTGITAQKTIQIQEIIDGPTAEQILPLIDVAVTDTNGYNNHGRKTYDLAANEEGATHYSVSSPYLVTEGTGAADVIEGAATLVDGGSAWRVDVTVYAAPYVARYNDEPEVNGVEHALAENEDSSKTVTLARSADGTAWTIEGTDGTATVGFDVVCSESPIEPVEPVAPSSEAVAEWLADQMTVTLNDKNDLHHGDGADAHPDVTFGAGSENALIAEGFTVSSPVKQETEGGGEAWTMEVTLDGQAYLNAYAQMANADGEPYGTHYFASADETGMRSFTLMLDTTADEPAWTLDASSEADITFDITCLTLQPAELDMYAGGTGSDHFPDAHVVDGMGNVYTIDELNELLDEGVTAAVKYYDAEGNEITDDEEPGEYTARIVVDGASGTRSGDDSTLNVNVGDADYEYALETSTLTIRNVSNVADAEAGETNVQLLESGATTEQIQAALATDDVVAQLPADTRILVNGREGGELTGDELDGVTLFSDELLGAEESGGLDRLQALVQKAIDAGYVFDSEDADFRYLDLVDAAQSNIWVSSTAGTTIYWKVPEDVDAENLRVLHFEGLHREYGVDAADLESQIAACSVESMELDTTHIADGYVSFTVDAAGFSPFALVTINPEPDAATVTFDAQGGTFADEAQVTREVTVGAMLGELPAVTRDGWTLAGWYTEPQGGEEVTADTVVEDGGAVTYYAHWTIDQATTTVTLTLDAGDGAAFEGGSQITSVVVPSGKPVHSSDLPTPTRDGFALEGWYLDEGFSQKVVFSDEADTGAQATTFNADTTLYAKLIGDLSDQITIPGIDEPVKETYNGGEHPVVPEYDGAFPEDERAHVIVEYRTAGSTGDDGWSATAPVDAGSYDVRVTYPGSDDYAPFVLEHDGVLVIEKATLAQTGLAASPAEVEAGTALASIQLAGGTVTMADGTPVSGSWSWANPNATVDASGVYQAVFTPDDADNFETLTVDVQLTVADSGGEPDGGDTDPDTPVTPDDPDGGSDQPSGNGGDDAGQSGGGSTSADAPTDGTLSSTGDATVLAVAATGALGAIAVAGGLLARRKKHEE